MDALSHASTGIDFRELTVWGASHFLNAEQTRFLKNSILF